MKCGNCKFSPSDFRVQIVIQERSVTPTPTGGQVFAWADFATVWAIAVEKHGNEQLISQQINAVDIYEFVIRYRPGVDESMRIQHRGKQLQIKSVIQEDGLNEFIRIKAVDEGDGT